VSLGDLPPTINAVDEPAQGRPVLVAVTPDSAQSHPLPESGTLIVGRAHDSDVRIDDAQISRHHVKIHVGAKIEVEDLGSANGTKVRGALLAVGTRAVVEPGEVIDLGSSLLILQRAVETSTRRRLWSHGYFEIRLEDECVRQQRKRSPFAVLRVHLDGTLDRARLEEALASDLRAGDLIAAYAPNEYEILLVDTARMKADRIGRVIRERVSQAGGQATVGIAIHPDDGVTPDALISAANRGVQKGAAPSVAGVIVEDDAMRDLYRVIDRIAPGKISVLLSGETGVGKEVVAEAVHARSPRATKPFVRLNCAALSETLVESELFGHEKGSFTGAETAKEGLLETGNGGTVLLDEVAELPLATQAKLLRVLEQREVLRVGSLKPRSIDVRFVSATHRDLDAEVAAGRFRQDLLYRLNGVTLLVPPLRDRGEEIEPMARAFVEQASAALGSPSHPEISAEAMALLESYGWPGNIRELKNVIERAVLLAGDIIEPAHLPLDKLTTTWTAAAAPKSKGSMRDRVLDALERSNHNQTRAAEMMGVSRQTLSKWLDRYDLPRPRKK